MLANLKLNARCRTLARMRGIHGARAVIAEMWLLGPPIRFEDDAETRANDERAVRVCDARQLAEIITCLGVPTTADVRDMRIPDHHALGESRTPALSRGRRCALRGH